MVIYYFFSFIFAQGKIRKVLSVVPSRVLSRVLARVLVRVLTCVLARVLALTHRSLDVALYLIAHGAR